jgi:hypothetical protein
MERAVFYVACHDCSEEHDTSLTGIMQKIYPIGVRHKMVRMFKDEKHLLQTTGLIELEKKSSIFGDSISIKPTDKGKELFFEEEAELYIEKIDNKELITCDKIAERHLFFELGPEAINSRSSAIVCKKKSTSATMQPSGRTSRCLMASLYSSMVCRVQARRKA